MARSTLPSVVRNLDYYVPLRDTEASVQRALEKGIRDTSEPGVVVLHGDPGAGKTSVAISIAWNYYDVSHSESSRSWRSFDRSEPRCSTAAEPDLYPDRSIFLQCGPVSPGDIDRYVADKRLELLLKLGAIEPEAGTSGLEFDPRFLNSESIDQKQSQSEISHYQACKPDPLHQRLEEFLVNESVLIVLEDVWPGDFLDKILVGDGYSRPEYRHVRYLVTSHSSEVCSKGNVQRVSMDEIPDEEARHILANYINARGLFKTAEMLKKRGQFDDLVPVHLQGVVDRILHETHANPLALATVAMSVTYNPNHSHDSVVLELEALENALQTFVKVVTRDLSEQYFRGITIPNLGLLMGDMLNGLSEEARNFLTLVSLYEEDRTRGTAVHLLHSYIRAELLKCQQCWHSRSFENNQVEMENLYLIHVDRSKFPEPEQIRLESSSPFKETLCRSSSSREFREPDHGQKRQGSFSLLEAESWWSKYPFLSSIDESRFTWVAHLRLLHKFLSHSSTSDAGIHDIQRELRRVLHPFASILCSDLDPLQLDALEQVIVKYVHEREIDGHAISTLLDSHLASDLCLSLFRIIVFIHVTGRRTVKTEHFSELCEALLSLLPDARDHVKKTKAVATLACLTHFTVEKERVDSYSGNAHTMSSLLWSLLECIKGDSQQTNSRQEWASLALLGLSQTKEYRRILAGDQNVFRYLVRVLSEEYSSFPMALQRAAWTFAHLCVTSEYREGLARLQDAGVSSFLVDFMQRSEEPELQEVGACSLAWLSGSREGESRDEIDRRMKEIAGWPGALEALVSLLAIGTSTRDRKSHIYSTAALSNISILPRPLVPHALQKLTHLLCSEAKAYSARALLSLCHGYKQEIVETPGCIDCLVTVAITDSSGTRLSQDGLILRAQECALDVLVQLCLNTSVHASIHKSSVLLEDDGSEYGRMADALLMLCSREENPVLQGQAADGLGYLYIMYVRSEWEDGRTWSPEPGTAGECLQWIREDTTSLDEQNEEPSSKWGQFTIPDRVLNDVLKHILDGPRNLDMLLRIAQYPLVTEGLVRILHFDRKPHLQWQAARVLSRFYHLDLIPRQRRTVDMLYSFLQGTTENRQQFQRDSALQQEARWFYNERRTHRFLRFLGVSRNLRAVDFREVLKYFYSSGVALAYAMIEVVKLESRRLCRSSNRCLLVSLLTMVLVISHVISFQ